MENYLRIRVEGKEGYLKAFLNANKEKGSEPDYKGEGVAVWVNQMEAEQQPASQEPDPYDYINPQNLRVRSLL